MPNPKNLKPAWKKGQTGNAAGRPKLPDIRAALAALLADEIDGRPALDAVLAALRTKALAGDVRAAEALLDRAFGKAVQALDVRSGDARIVAPPIVWSDQIPGGTS